MGRVSAPFGVKGWIRVHTFTALPGNLLDYSSWWLGRDQTWREIAVIAAKLHSNAVVAKLSGIEDRDAALELKGCDIGIARERLPQAGQDEFYWADLIGLEVVNSAGQALGRVARIFNTGANDVLVVDGKREILIPFVATAIQNVNIAAGQIKVDWGEDY